MYLTDWKWECDYLRLRLDDTGYPKIIQNQENWAYYTSQFITNFKVLLIVYKSHNGLGPNTPLHILVIRYYPELIGRLETT